MKQEKIIRRPDFAGGGLTEAERAAMAEHVKQWTARAFRTDPIEPDKITSAIHGMYRAAKLKEPRVVIVPSPLVMAIAGEIGTTDGYQLDLAEVYPNTLHGPVQAPESVVVAATAQLRARHALEFLDLMVAEYRRQQIQERLA